MILNSFYRFWVNRESVHDTPRIKLIYSFADIFTILIMNCLLYNSLKPYSKMHKITRDFEIGRLKTSESN